MLRIRSFIALLCIALALCAIGLRGVQSQTITIRRITTTTEEGVSLNPSLSGDGRRIAFESTEDLARVGGSDSFRALRATLTNTAVTFIQMGATRAVAPAISQDGSVIAFASKDNPLGTNGDGNSEIFLFDGTALRQLTNTSPGDISLRLRNGNFQPSITDDARFIAFSSNRDLAGLNSDGNLEIFIYDTVARSFAQLTNTAGTIGATDAKISGDGTRVAYIRDSNTISGGARDLLLQPRTGGAPLVAASGVINLSVTYGRAISDNGQRVVYAAPVGVGINSTQVLLYDALTSSTRQITALAAPDSDGDVPLHPTISGDGTRVAFATRRNVTGGNSDDSVELYVARVSTNQFTRITSAPSSATAAVVSSLNDDGSLVAFNFPRVLSGAVTTSNAANNSEIYVANTRTGTTGNELIVLNGASFGHEPSETKAVAPSSIAVALGDLLATTVLQAQPLSDGTFPLSLGGTTVTVNNRPAQIFSVSPELVTFLVPAATETGTAQVVVTNSTGHRSTGTVEVLLAAPGVFTRSGNGLGEGYIVDAQTGRFGPFDPTGGMKRLIIRATGVRNASIADVTVTIGGRPVPVEAVTPDPTMPGRDLIRILLPADLSGVGTVDLVVRVGSRASNPVTITMLGQARRDIIINEVLADPPLDLAGDANHDGIRDSSDDEFVELVNSTTRDIDISGYQILTRSATASEDTLRHVFPAGTIMPAGTAVVVFGGGSPPVNSPVFGGAQIFTAMKEGSTSSSLSLTNSGGFVTLRESTGALVASLSYGAATGIDADNDQSITRSPDITGGFVQHKSATGSGGRAFSPGTRVDGTPFSPTPAIARIEISPASASIGTGARQQFTARAFGSNGQELTGVIFNWQSSAPAVARIDQNGLATGLSPGSTQIRASARGVLSAPATLTVFFQAQVLTRIEVLPANASIPPGGQQQYTARAIDQNGNEIAGVTFTWASSNESVATINQNGLATALSLGSTTIRATARGITGTATLSVVAPVLIINEVLADPPGSETTDLEGDVNHDGVRSPSEDEFVELVNSSNATLDLTGWTLSTQSLSDGTVRKRHTFAQGTTLTARTAIVIFGGGDFDPNNPLFGCAQVVKASSGRLSLTNSGVTILVRDASGNLFAQFTYGSAVGLNGGSNQSLTRSPDITGNFMLHTAAAGADGRRFSPGTKVDGSPFGACAARLTRVVITPQSASVIINRTTQFTAQAFDQFGQPLKGITFTFSSSDTTVATIESVTTNATTGIATATVRGRKLGTTQITATATDGTTVVTSSTATLTVTPVPPRVTRVEVTPPTATINRGGMQQFTATAFNQSTPVPAASITWTSSNPAVATVDSNGLATGVGVGVVTITATAPDGLGGTVSDTATLTVQVPLVINEVLADVPVDNEATLAIEGDANRDGVRDSGDDEFVELFNNSNAPVDISGVIIADSTRNHFTFPANTILAAGRAVVVFGGGTPPVNDPAFGGSLILKASSLGLNDSGDTVTVKLPVAGTDVPIAVLAYGEGTTTPAASNRSMTRSPDAEIGTTGGDYVAHTSAVNAAGRVFSPGTRTDGTPFGSPAITRIEVLPASATLNVGGTKTFTARAFSNANGPEVEVQNVSFIWDSSDPTKAMVAPTTGATTTVKATGGGSVTIRARAGGEQGTAALHINFPTITRVTVTPASASIPLGGTQQFTAHAFDANNNEITGVTFTWTSSNVNVATVDQNGLATAQGLGTTTIKATVQGVSGTATLRVIAPQVVINEVLADPPGSETTDLEGDANHDGVRDSGDDEFVELVNTSAATVDISGWTLRTQSLEEGSTETLRHTFAANTTLAAGKAVVVFGGGTFDPNNPVLGGAKVVKASTGRLSLTNSGMTVIVRDAGGNLFAQFTYGGTTTLNGGMDQSLTRSPDAGIGTAGGNFVKHTTPPNAAGRRFSPGTRLDGTPFGSPAITRIQITPSSATINVGGTQAFTARAFSNVGGPEVEVQNVSFIWDSSDPTKATVSPTTGKMTTATAFGGGVVTIRARAGGQQGTATLKINFPPIARIVVTPSSARAPIGGTQAFTARAFDASNREITGLTFTWMSSNPSVATIDQNGLATAVGLGTTTIKASAQNVSDTATLNVVARTVVINEVLADPPDGLAGDANHDGVRDTSDDEFVELANGLTTAVNISGWSIRTRSETATSETLRHTFAANTTLPAGDAIVVFGGGTFDANDPVFGGAQVVAASTGRLSLTNTGLTVIVRDAAGNLVAQLTYGGTTGLDGGSNQSLTRSPDITGNFVLHTAAAGADGRRFSPGRKVDGSFFVPRTGHLASVTITPQSASVIINRTTQFTAQAFDQFGQPLKGITFTFSSSDTTVATIESVSTNATTGTATATVRGRKLGTTQITATASDGTTSVTSDPATLTVTSAPPRVTRVEVTPSSATINRGGMQQFTAQAFNQSTPVPTAAITWTSSNPAIATVDANGLATGVGVGVVTITATAPDGLGGTVSDTATLTVQVPLVINEVLADPPDGAAGDANRDGTRDGTQDEFIELVNNSNAPVDISGVIIADATSNRFTFPANTILAAGRAVVVFGGGTPPVNDPNFGGALIFKTGSGGLSLNNSADTINIKLPVGGTEVLITSLTYGAEADANQSITRSPDITGDFTKHSIAPGSDGRLFSPGERLDGTPFGSPAITRIEVLPASATINVGGTQTFTARAFSNVGGPEVEVQNVSFIWDSSDPSKATVAPTTGTSTVATGIAGGSVTIRARAGGQQGTASLTINFPPISRIEVTPANATITLGGTQQFTAHAFDANNNEITGVTFTWTSSDESVATIDQNGLATSVGLGTTTIKASAQGVEGTATLTVVAASVVINEVLADPPDGLAGDANHDGVRDGTDDEFVELVNSTASSVNISGWSIRTRPLSGGTETLRHTFAANTTLPAGDAIVVFGGGTFDANDPVFGGAQVVAASSGGLSLTNTGLTVVVRDAAGEFVAQFSYGGTTGLNGDSNQSLTRSPDITGNFVLHTAAAGANGRRFSPGRKVDGSFFVPRTGHLTSVEISPTSATVVAGQTTQFTAQAFDQFGQPMTGITISFSSSDTSVATIESVMTDPNTGIATAVVRGEMSGTAEIKATANDGTTTVMSSPAMLTVTTAPPMVSSVVVTPSTSTINRGGTQQFTATAFDASNQPVPGVTFTWTSSNTAVATVDSDGLATGVGIGTVTITATTSDGASGTVSGDATLTVQVPLLINEALVQVPTDNAGTPAVEGDSNRDGVRSSDDDEFVELFNNSNAPVDISGVIIADSTNNRFTFPANTILAAGRAVVVFGGGTPPVNDPAFGGALIFTTSSLGLTDGGDTITVKLPVNSTDVTIDTLAYGTGNPIPAPGAQSLTRSPDAEVGSAGGSFVPHSTATNAAGRVFSPGTRANGTPFGSPAITRIEVLPASATINVGGTQAFTARAFSNVGGPEVEVQNVSFIWDSSDPSKATVAPITGASTTATGVAAGSVTIRARAGGQESSSTLVIESVVASIELTPAATSVTVGNSTTFTATARDGSGNPISGITFVFSLRDQMPAGAATITATTANTVTVRGDLEGSVTVVASYTRPSDNVTLEDTSALTINNAPPAPQPTAGQVIINEALVAFATSTTQTRNDFLELYNTTAQALDISGMVVSFRPSGTGNTPATVTLPGAVGSNTTLIQPNSYFLVVNGAESFGAMADFNASTQGFDLNNTTGGIKIEVNGVKLDGLAYQGGATAPASPFNTYGEGAIFTFTSGTTNDLIRSPNANDTGDNANDFRRNGTAANVTPKAANPTLFFSQSADEEVISFLNW
ncbi:MAG TPA: lamin tail domain-containing protein [Pyrinomonadaceae bacterium]